MTHFIRRLLLGMIIGLVIAGSSLVVVHIAFATSSNGVSVADLGGSGGILVEYVSELNHAPTLTRLATYQPQVVLVACFPYIFPPDLLQLPPRGCLNLHPSLLPAYRGPAPLFWQFRRGERQTGVTLHLMDERPDAGDILLQKPVALPDGITGPEADILLAQQGGQLMAEALGLLEQDALAPRVQNESEGSYYPWPTEGDFQISAEWSARRAFNFIRGTQEWGCAFEITIEQERFLIQSALSYSAQHELDKPYTLIGRELWVQFSPGVLRAVVAHACPCPICVVRETYDSRTEGNTDFLILFGRSKQESRPTKSPVTSA